MSKWKKQRTKEKGIEEVKQDGGNERKTGNGGNK